MKTGTLVVSKSRMPSAHQPWSHEVYVGKIIEPGDDPADWNGHNSERHYCELMGYAKVQYGWGAAHDSWKDLIEITQEQAELTPIEKVFVFIGEEAAETWIRHSSGEAEKCRALLARHRKLEEPNV
jgi:hypothetical protein